jgi:hypothetical protein
MKLTSEPTKNNHYSMKLMNMLGAIAFETKK